MAATFDDLRILKLAEGIADAIWKRVVQWDEFARDVVGKQLARAADSIGANIAEAYGRYHFGEKLQFLYYARGSLFETKFWLNRAKERELMTAQEIQNFVSQLTALARQLNAFADGIKAVRSGGQYQAKSLRETTGDYTSDAAFDFPDTLFDSDDIAWLES